MERRPAHDSEFAAQRGERQRQGDPDVYGVPAPVGPVAIGPAPSYPRHVFSTFDSRPIGSYDFAVTVQLNQRSGPPPYRFVWRAPLGYMTFLRAVEFEPENPLFVLAGIVPNGWRFRMERNEVVLPNIEWLLTQQIGLRRFDVALVYAPDDEIALRLDELTPVVGAPVESHILTARYYGTLVLLASEPPENLVGSNEDGIIGRLVQRLRL